MINLYQGFEKTSIQPDDELHFRLLEERAVELAVFRPSYHGKLLFNRNDTALTMAAEGGVFGMIALILQVMTIMTGLGFCSVRIDTYEIVYRVKKAGLQANEEPNA